MPISRSRGVDRRQFLRRVGALAGAAAAVPLEGRSQGAAPGGPPGPTGVALLPSPAARAAAAGPAQWAAELLLETCRSRGLGARACRRVEDARPTELRILAAGSGTARAQEVLRKAGAGAPHTPESLALVPVRHGDGELLLASAPDALGLVYAFTELVDRIECAPDALAALRVAAPVADRPACLIRRVMRLFVTDVKDKSCWHDRSLWRHYVTILVTQRFNRINLALGLGSDFARQLRDTYSYLPYPFLDSVPAYNVLPFLLADRDRGRNHQR